MGQKHEPRAVGRPPKFSPDELKDRLLAAGVESLRTAGVTQGLDAVRLDAAIHEAGVPRGSAYRVWSSTDGTSPQDVFRREVLLRLLRSTPLSTGLGVTRAAAEAELAKHSAALESDDPDQRAAVLREMIRVVAAVNFNNIVDSQTWRVYRAVATAATTRSDADADIIEAIRTGEERLVAGYGEFFAEFAALFRLRLRPGVTMSEFVMCTYALNEGLANRPSSGYRLSGIPLPGETSATKDWTLVAIGLEALVTQFFELDD